MPPRAADSSLRVRICTCRSRCHSSCRKSRISASGTQIRGKRSSIISRSNSCTSCRSVFSLRTRLVRISAASPIHNSSFNSLSKRSNQRAPRWLPSPPARSVPRARDKAARILREGSNAARRTLHFLCPKTQFVGSPDDSHNLYSACSGRFLRALWLVYASKVYSGLEADIVMESIQHSRLFIAR